MRSQFIDGDRILLREVRASDVSSAYYGWMNDPEVTRFLESRFFPQSVEQLQAFVSGKTGSRENVFLAIVLQETSLHIGNIKLGPIDWIHRTADIGLVIGDRDCWGKGYASEAIELLSTYAFRTLNLRKLTASCYAPNEGSVRAFVKAGFEVEGARPSQFYSDGRYVDQVLLGRMRSDP